MENKTMYKCLHCGAVFEEGQQAVWSENRGVFWGETCYEDVSGCPLCGQGYREATKCEICGEYFLADDSDRACNDCIEKYRYDIDMCFKVGSGDTENVKINWFLSCMFKPEEIEQILLQHLKSEEEENRTRYEQELRIYGKANLKKIDCKKFIDVDREWFAEGLVEEVKNNEKKENQSSND